MGGGCYRSSRREMLEVGSWCENACFQEFGGCEGSITGDITKPSVNCEYKPSDDERLPIDMDKVNQAIESTEDELFLYTPDMFQEFYLDGCLKQLPDRENVYLIINACVRSFIDSGVTFAELYEKGIREIWFGIESADLELRNRYSKLPFTNEEVMRVSKEGHDADINVCWFLVDGVLDTATSRLATYELIRDAAPFRVQFGKLQQY